MFETQYYALAYPVHEVYILIVIALSRTSSVSQAPVIWNQKWNIDFVEEYEVSLSEYTGIGPVETCYLPSTAFSPLFEDIAQPMVIEDTSDE